MVYSTYRPVWTCNKCNSDFETFDEAEECCKISKKIEKKDTVNEIKNDN